VGFGARVKKGAKKSLSGVVFMEMKFALVAVLAAGLLLFGCAGTPDRGTSKIFGPDDAKVSFVIYSDFQCPACGSAEPTVNRLMGDYAGRVRFVFKQFPLRGIHENAQKAAEAAECSLDQGKFWEMHDKMFENQQALFDADLKKYARELKMDGKTFDACLDSGEKYDAVQKDLDDGVAAGVQATPSFFINGQLIEGGVAYSEFQKAIDADLA
jgi:protein-disulfide isomerase